MNKNITEKIVISLYVISHTILLFYMLWTNEYAGEFYGRGNKIDISNNMLVFLYLITLSGYLIVYFIYTHIKNVKLSIHAKMNVNRFHFVFMLLLLMHLSFYLITGVGKVSGSSSSRFSSIFSLLNIDCIFGIYYISCRERKLKYIFNILLYFLFQMLKGWSGMILTITIYELYFFCKSSFFKRFKYKTLIWIYFVPVFLSGGGIAYKLFYPIKQFIRYGYYEAISLGEGIIKLINRMSYFPITAMALQNCEKMKEIYLNQKIEFLDLNAMLRPVLPRFVMPFKEFRSLNNIVINSVYPDLGINTSSGFGFWMYGFILYKVNLVEFLSWAILTLVLMLLVFFIYKFIEQKPGQFDFLIFLFMINFIQTASLESAFSYYYLYLLYMIPLLFMAGVFKFVKISKS